MPSLSGEPPLLIYDGECAFCRVCVEYGERLTGGRVAYAPFQEAAECFPHIPADEFRRAVQLIFPNGEVLTAAHAVFRALDVGGSARWLLWAYRHVPGFAPLAEAVYGWVARNRALVWRVVRRYVSRA